MKETGEQTKGGGRAFQRVPGKTVRSRKKAKSAHTTIKRDLVTKKYVCKGKDGLKIEDTESAAWAVDTS